MSYACGHDNHMAILLGAATMFARMREQLPGTIKLIFQPAEEGRRRVSRVAQVDGEGGRARQSEG